MYRLIDRLKTWEETSSFREKVLVFIIVILLPLFIFFKFYYIPVKEKIDILKRDITRLNLKIKQYNQLAKKKEILIHKLNQRKKFLEFAKNILPTEKEIPALLKNLALVIKRNNLEILLFKPAAERFKNYYKEIPISLEVAGDFKDVINFLNDTGDMARLLVLDKIEIKEKDNKKIDVYAIFKTFQYTGKIVSAKNKRSL